MARTRGRSGAGRSATGRTEGKEPLNNRGSPCGTWKYRRHLCKSKDAQLSRPQGWAHGCTHCIQCRKALNSRAKLQSQFCFASLHKSKDGLVQTIPKGCETVGCRVHRTVRRRWTRQYLAQQQRRLRMALQIGVKCSQLTAAESRIPRQCVRR